MNLLTPNTKVYPALTKITQFNAIDAITFQDETLCQYIYH